MNRIKRLRNVSIARPIVYGNMARILELPPVDHPDHTHRWTVSVKGITDRDDVSYFIKKVAFKLHETYDTPTRIIESPPFEVTETGWGEFECQIRVHFVSEASEKSLQLFHHIKLHPFKGPKGEPLTNKEDIITSYHYDEIVFNEPSEVFFDILLRHPPPLLPQYSSQATINSPYSKQVEKEEIERLQGAISKVQEMTKTYKAQISVLEKQSELGIN